MDPFFSIVIPVYKVEKYINQCVDSILSQSFQNYEIILVDDGSPDNCPFICDYYALKYSNIKAVHKENGGLSDARNLGISHSRGEYILFVDSDDYICEDSLTSIYNTIVGNCSPDVVFLEAKKLYPDGVMTPMCDGYKHEYIDGKSHIDVLRFISIMNKYPGSACTKAIRRTLFNEELMFTKDLLSEDIEWTYRLFISAQKYAYCSADYYVYRQEREGSISNTVGGKKIESMLWTIEKWAKIVPADELETLTNSFVAYQYLIMIYNISNMENKGSYMKRAAKSKWILQYGKSKKCKVVYWTAKCIGINATGQLLKYFRRVRRFFK